MPKKVLIAMSGGVDSSITAYLLQKKGFQVEGLFVFFQSPQKMQAQLASAQAVADFLKIKLNTLDLSEKFSQEIINDFINQYKTGNTPNPCIRCNKYFKFGKLLDYTKQKNFDYLATGHYAKIKNNKLTTAKDKSKDQSYFLYNLNQEILPFIKFPLGNHYKKNIKKLAKKINLPVKQSKESTDVCFIPQQDTQKFLKQKISGQPGNILNTDKKTIGQHQGLEFYTLGQRKGINIGGTGPYYVVKKDFKNNNLIVTNDKNDPQLFSTKLFVKNINWISEKPKLPLTCLAQHRYQTKMEEAIISPLAKGEIKRGNKLADRRNHQNIFLVTYKKPQRAITPGQSVVFYKRKNFFSKNFEVLGGGVITKNT